MFPGQGAQYLNMAVELYRTESRFRESVDSCLELVNSHIGEDLRPTLYPPEESSKDAAEQLTRTEVTQVSLFVIEYALAKLWMGWGVHPDAMIGYSLGEYVAACLAGVFSPEDALALVAERGRLMQKRPRGAMLVVPLSEAKTQSLLGPKLCLAAVNGPSLCVVSGPVQAVKGLETRLEKKGVSGARLNTSHAFHSAMMEAVLKPFQKCVGKVALKPPKIPYISNVTGTWIKDEEATDPGYWSKHLRQTVCFACGIRELLKNSDSIFLEIGPGRQLGSLVTQNSSKHRSDLILASLPHPLEPWSDSEFLLSTLAQLWLSGVEIDWPRVHAHEPRLRVHLPTYPFERERYWVEPLDETTRVEADLSRIKRTDIASWFYVPSWEHSISPETEVPEKTARRQFRWLVFTDARGVGAQVVKKLEEHKQDVTVVRAGERFSKEDHRLFEINPREKGHYKALFKELRLLGRAPEKIIHLWSIARSDQAETTIDSFESAQDLGFYSLLYLAQALIGRQTSSSTQITVITNETHLVTGSERLCPAKATVLATCKSIPQEYPDIRFRTVDIVLPDASSLSSGILSEQLLAEIMADASDPVVAYRESQRWVQTFEAANLHGPYDPTAFLRKGGVYLITGGLGNIGLRLAEQLAKLVRPRLALLGRSDFPNRRSWNEWLLSHSEDDAVSRKIRKIRAIERLGSKVILLRADVSSEEQMRDVVEQIYQRFGAINGVIHGAGTIAADTFFSIDEADPKRCERHFVPKVRGLIVLENVLRGKNIDFYLMVSSLSSILAGLGFLAYSAANIFMDAFASERNRETGVSWVSVNWDNWAFQEGSDSAAESGEADLAMLPAQGVETFRRILSSAWPTQVVVSVSDLHARIDQWIKLKFLQRSGMRRKGVLHARPNLENPYVAPRNRVEQTIGDVWSDCLGIEKVSVHDNFFSDLSGTSLMATQLVSRLRSQLRVDLPLRRFFEGPTVAEIAQTVEAIQEGDESRGEVPIDEAIHQSTS